MELIPSTVGNVILSTSFTAQAAGTRMVELRIQPEVKTFVDTEYGQHGLEVLKTAVTRLRKQLRWANSAAIVRQRMDGSFDIDGANILKKYVSGPQQSWRMAVKRVDEKIYAVEMFAAKNDEDLLIRKLQKKF